MRFFRMFPLSFQQVLEKRSRSMVWFVATLMGPLTMMYFWQGALKQSHVSTSNWNPTIVFNYYFLSILCGSLLIAHPEFQTSEHDINQGFLSTYLLKPYPYFLYIFLLELPHRILQGIFSLIIFLVLLLFGVQFAITTNILTLLLTVAICAMALFMSFTFKMIVAFVAFWTDTIVGLEDIVEVSLIVLGGLIMPIYLYPPVLRMVATVLPFSYMIYYPVMSFLGKFSYAEQLRILVIQCIWLADLYGIHYLMWKGGLKRFTAAGQ